MKADKFKGDGYDQERIDAAKLKRERKAQKRIHNAWLATTMYRRI